MVLSMLLPQAVLIFHISMKRMVQLLSTASLPENSVLLFLHRSWLQVPGAKSSLADSEHVLEMNYVTLASLDGMVLV